MAKLPGLYRRKDGGTFQLRVMIPLDLRELYGKTQFVEDCGRDALPSCSRRLRGHLGDLHGAG
ncbi:MAG: DUF6538 domain-containing protein [Caldimonas sp.]